MLLLNLQPNKNMWTNVGLAINKYLPTLHYLKKNTIAILSSFTVKNFILELFQYIEFHHEISKLCFSFALDSWSLKQRKLER